eukprot:1394832-Amorphochlora_amoeboformis.AAC.1
MRSNNRLNVPGITVRSPDSKVTNIRMEESGNSTSPIPSKKKSNGVLASKASCDQRNSSSPTQTRSKTVLAGMSRSSFAGDESKASPKYGSLNDRRRIRAAKNIEEVLLNKRLKDFKMKRKKMNLVWSRLNRLSIFLPCACLLGLFLSASTGMPQLIAGGRYSDTITPDEYVLVDDINFWAYIFWTFFSLAYSTRVRTIFNRKSCPSLFKLWCFNTLMADFFASSRYSRNSVESRHVSVGRVINRLKPSQKSQNKN